VSNVGGVSVPYITWSLPQQVIADAGCENEVEQEALSEGEGSGNLEDVLGDAGGGQGEEEESWDDLLLDDD
jgi:hypothetical protein